MTYQVLIQPAAQRQIRKLPKQIQIPIAQVIRELADNPRPDGVKKLQSSKNLYRIRIGNYRVIYQVFDDIVTVTIVKVGHRRDVYQ
jgi:mRNA interferase RelE/StbE